MQTRSFPPRRIMAHEDVSDKVSELSDDSKRNMLLVSEHLVTFEALLNGHEITEQMAISWRLSYPFSIYDAKRIVKYACRMPKTMVKDYLFPGRDFEPDETDFFEVLADFGKAHGIALVTEPLFDGAVAGDPRAVKMYLELLRALDPDAAEEDEAALRKLMRVNINLG